MAGSGCTKTRHKDNGYTRTNTYQHRRVSTYWSVINKYQHQEVHSILQAEDRLADRNLRTGVSRSI